MSAYTEAVPERSREKQERHQEEGEGLVKLLHPIRDCPEDILRLIFEEAVKDKEDDWFTMAMAISHVCRAWRILALEMSLLWSRTVLSLRNCPDRLGALESFLELFQSRVQSTPADVTIIDIRWSADLINASQPIFYNVVRLNRFTHLSRLSLYLTSRHEIQSLDKLAFKYDFGPLECLTIGAHITNRVYRPSRRGCEFIFRKFPTANHIVFQGLGVLQMDGDDTFPSIHQLTLESTVIPSLMSQIHRFGCIEELSIKGENGLSRMNIVTHEVTLDTLRKLSVSRIYGFPWHRLRAPRLTSLELDDKIEDAIDFVLRHVSIREFHYNSPRLRNMLDMLAPALIHLHTLSIMGSFKGLYQYQYSGFTSLPFPKLSYLRVKLGYGGGFKLSLQEFESLVQIRCLLEHIQAENEVVKKLKTLEFTGRTEDFDGWRDSALLDCFEQTWSKEALNTSRYSLVLKLKDGL